jgi:hypothetical protein
MFHVPSDFGVSQWAMSFDHLAFAWVAVAVVVLSAALWLLPCLDAIAARWHNRQRRSLDVVGPSHATHRPRFMGRKGGMNA